MDENKEGAISPRSNIGRGEIMKTYTTNEEWLDIFYDAWQPQSADEAKDGRMAYGEIRDATLEQKGD